MRYSITGFIVAAALAFGAVRTATAAAPATAPATAPAASASAIHSGTDMRNAVPAEFRGPSTSLQRKAREDWIKAHFRGLIFQGTVNVEDVRDTAVGGLVALGFRGGDANEPDSVVLGTVFFPASQKAALGKLHGGQRINVRGAIKTADIPQHGECSVVLESATFVPVPGQ